MSPDNDTCVKVFGKKNGTWMDAKTVCRQDAELVRIESGKKRSFVAGKSEMDRWWNTCTFKTDLQALVFAWDVWS